MWQKCIYFVAWWSISTTGGQIRSKYMKLSISPDFDHFQPVQHLKLTSKQQNMCTFVEISEQFATRKSIISIHNRYHLKFLKYIQKLIKLWFSLTFIRSQLKFKMMNRPQISTFFIKAITTLTPYKNFMDKTIEVFKIFVKMYKKW
jgi:hypothetical protein